MVIERDGGIHLESLQRERDENRQYELERFGLKVIRFSNDEVMTDLLGVIEDIKRELADRVKK